MANLLNYQNKSTTKKKSLEPPYETLGAVVTLISSVVITVSLIFNAKITKIGFDPFIVGCNGFLFFLVGIGIFLRGKDD